MRPGETIFCSKTTCPTFQLFSYLKELKEELDNSSFYFQSFFPSTVNIDERIILEFKQDLLLLQDEISNSKNCYLESNGLYCCCIDRVNLLKENLIEQCSNLINKTQCYWNDLNNGQKEKQLTMQIFVTNMLGSTVAVAVGEDVKTVEQLHDLLSLKCGVSRNKFYLSCDGRKMENDFLLSSFNLREHSQIVISPRMKGGVPNTILTSLAAGLTMSIFQFPGWTIGCKNDGSLQLSFSSKHGCWANFNERTIEIDNNLVLKISVLKKEIETIELLKISNGENSNLVQSTQEIMIRTQRYNICCGISDTELVEWAKGHLESPKWSKTVSVDSE